jgi:NAD(P)-dependent dehydrogenase (short-subunit alcohol dehydrogenase family)
MSGKRPGHRGSVVITGTSTGIGAATAVHLAQQGFTVFAGVRRASDGAALSSQTSGELTPLVIDITDPKLIANAVETVGAAVGELGLAGLVNNAGIVKPGPLEFQPLDDFRQQLEVNLVGHLAVIQAFLPLIRQGRGRIVNVGSIGGRLALPIHGAYSASKFGMEALSDALRLELRQWRIQVSLVDPGPTQSAIFGKTIAALDALKVSLEVAGHDGYDGQIKAIRASVEKSAADASPALVLARVIAEALTTDKPKARYLAGKGAKEIAALARIPSDRVKDLAIAKDIGLPDPA